MDECKPLAHGAAGSPTDAMTRELVCFLGAARAALAALATAAAAAEAGDGSRAGRRRLPASKPVLKAPMVSALEGTI